KERMIPLLDFFNKKGGFSEIIPISALHGENVDRLVEMALSFLPEGEPYFPEDVVTDQPVRFLAAEIIREKLIERTRDEVPYAIAVQIEEFKEDEAKNLSTIRAVLFVERESQKGILIGQGGKMLKEVGTAARQELETLLGAKIFLQLWVKTKKGWSKDDAFLSEMGY